MNATRAHGIVEGLNIANIKLWIPVMLPIKKIKKRKRERKENDQ